MLAVEVGDFDAVVGVVAAALELVADVVVDVELVVLELLLPQPAISAPQSNVTASFENRPAVTFSPFDLLSARSASRWRSVGAVGARLAVRTDARAQMGGLGGTENDTLTSQSWRAEANAVERSRPSLFGKRGVCPVGGE